MQRTAVGLLTVVVVAMIVAVSTPARAHDYDRGNSDHPMRYLAYLVHPFGIALEYGIARPIHQLASQPHWRIILGHAPRNERDEHGNYPVCNLDKAPPPVSECPVCHRPILKPRDEYWAWK